MYFFLIFAIFNIATANYIPGKAFDRFVTIWLENEDFTTSANNSQIKDLASQGILLTQYYGVTHPSQPNYLASVGGDYFGLDHDGTVTIPRNVSTIVDLLDTKFIDWRGYFEDIPGPGYMGPVSKRPDGKHFDYVRKHNPFVSYDSINRNGSRLSKVLSFRDFERDIKANNLPQYMHLSPNMLNDGHDTSSSFAIDWTSKFLKPLLSNKYFMNRTLILLTYDESRTMDKPNQITSILLGDAVPKNLQGTVDNTLYTHYSILSTIENNWDLPCLGRYDVGANVFSLVASQTNYINKTPTDLFAVNNSHSYPGYLSKGSKKSFPIPSPNLKLIGAGGKAVAEKIQKTWNFMAKNNTPYDGSGLLYDGSDRLPTYRQQNPSLDLTEALKGSRSI
ncbi:putative acid phosphatase [Erysiphe necator]|uniref:Putative acid phosphatase-like protein n=1 Tax=Uncinula necator TaxID=52586 RepID=A0A0B1PB48_UNCNE|nr:putative acid phosphatase [Erysiphe necator]KHJ33864.1 putative acid phosphatase-like protein [Erysiphe necator]